MKKIILSILVCLVLIGCEDEESNFDPPFNEPTIMTANGGFENAPITSGIVVREDGLFFGLIIIDQRSGMTATIGVDVDEFCAGNPDIFDFFPIQQIFNPVDLERILTVRKTEMIAFVYEGVLNGPLCDFFTNSPLIGSGMADVTETDNDLNAFLLGNKNQNAYGWRVHGNLTNPAGGESILNAFFNANWDGNDFSTLKIKQGVRVSQKP